MASRSQVVTNMACLLAGAAVGVLAHAGYRGDIQWTGPAPGPSDQNRAVAAAPPSQIDPSTLPDLPISLSYFENRVGRGYVVQLHNQSQKHLAVLVELENSTLQQQHAGSVQLAPGELQQISSAQGWTFVSGETIRLKHDGYKQASLTIP